MRRICGTRARKRAVAALRGAGALSPRAAVSGPVFQGRVYLVSAVFQGSDRAWSLPTADQAVLLDYLGRAMPSIGRYANQYGPVQLSLGPTPIPLTVRLAAPQYSDRDLQGWVNGLIASAHLDERSAVLLVNPPGLTNSDAQESGGVGVLGYHGLARIPYCFVNALGTGFTLDDAADRYAEAVSHEIAEMAVDPRADDANPEVCDGCGTNCLGSGAYRAYFDDRGTYLGSAARFPPPFPYAYFLSAIARPASAADCPAPASACGYPPP